MFGLEAPLETKKDSWFLLKDRLRQVKFTKKTHFFIKKYGIHYILFFII